jgi:hypothetical protein
MVTPRSRYRRLRSAESSTATAPSNLPTSTGWVRIRSAPDMSVSLTAFGLEPQGIFRFDGTACASGDRRARQAGRGGRAMPYRVSRAGHADRGGGLGAADDLRLSGTVHCATCSSGNKFAGPGGTQTQFTAQPGVVPNPGQSSWSTPGAGGSSWVRWLKTVRRDAANRSGGSASGRRSSRPPPCCPLSCSILGRCHRGPSASTSASTWTRSV